MFQPETEDMLPRTAPIPSAATPTGHNEVVVKPTVPEVSILFGQQVPVGTATSQPTTTTTTGNTQPQQSYAAWKKQGLPRVRFPATIATEFGTAQSTTSSSSSSGSSSTTSSEYGQQATVTHSTQRTTSIESTSTDSTIPNVAYVDPLERYRRNYENRYVAPMPSRVGIANTSNRFSEQRRSLDVTHLERSDVLTICAGTQTEDIQMSPIQSLDTQNIASKQDIHEVHCILQEMREQQFRLLQLCEAVLYLNQQRTVSTVPPINSMVTLKDASIQCELLASNNANTTTKGQTPIVHGYIAEEPQQQASAATPMQQQHIYAYNQLKNAQQLFSPRTMPPAAQSTAYRPNTPQTKHLPVAANNVGGSVMPKPNTEKSMVMNELALKYLPQEKLTELLQELRMSPTQNEQEQVVDCQYRQQQQQQQQQNPVTPLRAIENYEKSPNDISNASYKYLKKYRLLPEDHIDYQQPQTPVTGRKSHSPFQQRARSPLTVAPGRASPAGGVRFEENMLNLENIRNQPKFL